MGSHKSTETPLDEAFYAEISLTVSEINKIRPSQLYLALILKFGICQVRKNMILMPHGP